MIDPPARQNPYGLLPDALAPYLREGVAVVSIAVSRASESRPSGRMLKGQAYHSK
jgi:hypothetical protein